MFNSISRIIPYIVSVFIWALWAPVAFGYGKCNAETKIDVSFAGNPKHTLQAIYGEQPAVCPEELLRGLTCYTVVRMLDDVLTERFDGEYYAKAKLGERFLEQKFFVSDRFTVFEVDWRDSLEDRTLLKGVGQTNGTDLLFGQWQSRFSNDSFVLGRSDLTMNYTQDMSELKIFSTHKCFVTDFSNSKSSAIKFIADYDKIRQGWIDLNEQNRKEPKF